MAKNQKSLRKTDGYGFPYFMTPERDLRLKHLMGPFDAHNRKACIDACIDISAKKHLSVDVQKKIVETVAKNRSKTRRTIR